MSRSIALLLSYLLHPAIYPILGTLLVLRVTPYHIPFKMFLICLVTVFVGTYVIPILASVILYRLKIIASLDMKVSGDRRVPYLIGALCYYLVAEVLQQLRIPVEAYHFLLASTIVIVLHLLVLRRHKPSAHLAGIGGFTGLVMCLSLKYSINFLPLIATAFILTGFIASARLMLGAHSRAELISGYFSGLVIIFAMCYFL